MIQFYGMYKSAMGSIITPVFNSEKIILDMINSVLNQTYKNWELILVDDCSTDKSWKILKELKEKDSRINIFNIFVFLFILFELIDSIMKVKTWKAYKS